MFTLGYSFKSWTEPKAIADGPRILNYVRETAMPEMARTADHVPMLQREKLCGGPHHLAMNSRATSIAGLRPHQSAMAACFVFWREISRTAFWDFCNTIST